MIVFQGFHEERHRALVLQHSKVARRHPADPMLFVAERALEGRREEFLQRRDNRFQSLHPISIDLDQDKCRLQLLLSRCFALENFDQPLPFSALHRPSPDGLADDPEHRSDGEPDQGQWNRLIDDILLDIRRQSLPEPDTGDHNT